MALRRVRMTIAIAIAIVVCMVLASDMSSRGSRWFDNPNEPVGDKPEVDMRQ